MRCVRLYQFLPTKARMAFFFFFAGKAHVSCAAGRVCFLRCMRRVCAGANLPRCKLRKAVHVFSVRKMHVCALLAVIRFPPGAALYADWEILHMKKGAETAGRGNTPSHPYRRVSAAVKVKFPAKPGLGPAFEGSHTGKPLEVLPNSIYCLAYTAACKRAAPALALTFANRNVAVSFSLFSIPEVKAFYSPKRSWGLILRKHTKEKGERQALLLFNFSVRALYCALPTKPSKRSRCTALCRYKGRTEAGASGCPLP